MYQYITFGNTKHDVLFKAIHRELKKRGCDVDILEFKELDDTATPLTLLSFRKNESHEPISILFNGHFDDIELDDVTHTISKHMGWYN